MKTWLKVILVSLLGVAVVSTFGSYTISKRKESMIDETIKDKDKLLIGTLIKSNTNEEDVSINKIHIDIYDNSKIVESISRSMDDKSLVIDDRYSNIAFVDLTNIMKRLTNGIGISFWCKQSPNKNYISVRTEFDCSILNYVSSAIKIDDSGRWFINIPTFDDDVPQVEHSYFYQHVVYDWGE